MTEGEPRDLAGDVLALYASLGQPPLIIGASMGGAAALFAQGRVDEQLFRGLVLVDITPDVDMDGGRRIIAFMTADPDGYSSLDEAAQAIGAFRGGRGRPSSAGLSRVLRQGEGGRWRWHWDPRILDVRKTWMHDPAAADEYGAKLRVGMVGGAERLTVPCLLVRGGRSDVVTAEAARKLLALIPHATFVDVADASHMVAGDRNDVFTTAVLNFAAPLLAIRRPHRGKQARAPYDLSNTHRAKHQRTRG